MTDTSRHTDGSGPPHPRRRGLFADQRASASVDFSLLLPIFVIILLGTIDLGRFAYAAITVTNAARTGAAFCNYVRSSELGACTISRVKQEVINAAAPYLTITESQIAVDPPSTCTTSYGPCLEVTVTYPFATSLRFPFPGDGGWTWSPMNFTIRRSAQMRVALLD